MLTALQCKILTRISQKEPNCCNGFTFKGNSRLTAIMGDSFLPSIVGKKVIDFGCGDGSDAIEMAEHGATVIGLDIREDVLETARKRAIAAGLQAACHFERSTGEMADVILSVDAFEHFGDPAEILRIMAARLRPSGEAFISFGPTWYHPLGGHLFSVFPWAHLVFSEKAFIQWRSRFKTDGATSFREVAGGLNQITIARFERLVSASPFRFSSMELVPIKKLHRLHNRVTREFTTAVVRCRLVKR